jgi:hypothetical protein
MAPELVALQPGDTVKRGSAIYTVADDAEVLAVERTKKKIGTTPLIALECPICGRVARLLRSRKSDNETLICIKDQKSGIQHEPACMIVKSEASNGD